jgi:hypothetical protein
MLTGRIIDRCQACAYDDARLNALNTTHDPDKKLPPSYIMAASVILGRRFGHLTAYHSSLPRHDRDTQYTCLCDCGRVEVIPERKLIAKLATACQRDGCRFKG